MDETRRELSADVVETIRLAARKLSGFQRRQFHQRGRKKTEVKSPRLIAEIQRFVEPTAQADPKFQTTLAYTRITASTTIERGWGILEHHWNGALLDTIESALLWAGTMTWHGLKPTPVFST